MATASPWDALLKASPQRLRALGDGEHAAATEAPSGSKLATLLCELQARGTATTLTLSVCCDLDPRQVWGLLKAPRQRGQVFHEGGRWRLNTHYAGHQVERAAALLRELGWTVTPPAGGIN